MAAGRWEGIVLGGVATVAAISIGQFIDDGEATVISLSAMCLAMSIRLSWPLRKKPWLWLVIVVAAALHALAIGNLDWSDAQYWRHGSLALFVYADVGATLAIIYLVYRALYGKPVEVIEHLPDEPRYSDRDIDL